MNVLWITNTIFPAPSNALGLPVPVVGGWMYSLAGQLAANANINLAVATVYNGTDLKKLQIDGISYYLLPSRISFHYNKELEPFWVKVTDECAPDIVHIHGTEFPHGLACMRTCPDLKYVISIQGLVSVCARYYFAGLTMWDIIRNITFRDVVRWDTILHGKTTFTARGRIEEEYIQRTNHVIGRTSWDYAHVKTINPSVSYHFSNETLRDSFYSAEKWNIHKIHEHTIFLSQAAYPLKGLHQVLKAVALLKKEFPDIKVRIAGQSIVKNATLVDRLKITGYGSFIKKLISQLDLDTQVTFTGLLTEEKMIAEYQNAHLFICPSSIENSPNSVGEAQLVGVPTVASFVGGVADMVTHGKTGLLYRFEEVEMLAENIRLIFNNNELAKNISAQGIAVAEQRHNQNTNHDNTISIYRHVSGL